MIGSNDVAELATRIFECVANYTANLNNGEIIMAHAVAAHLFMTVRELEFEKQIQILHACADLLAKQNPVRMVKLSTDDVVETLARPTAN